MKYKKKKRRKIKATTAIIEWIVNTHRKYSDSVGLSEKCKSTKIQHKLLDYMGLEAALSLNQLQYNTRQMGFISSSIFGFNKTGLCGEHSRLSKITCYTKWYREPN